MGGTWQTQNKVRPGAYVNVRSDSMAVSLGGERGIVTMPWVGGFGPLGEVIEIDATTDVLTLLGHDWSDPEMLPIREALKRANRVLVYRVGGGTAATLSLMTFNVTAIHPGTRGNAITMRIYENPDPAPGQLYTVQTFVDSRMVDEQISSTVSGLRPNAFVRFSGPMIEPTAGAPLVGGTDSEPTAGDFAGYFAALETHEFNVMALPVADNVIKQLGVAYIQRLRADEGRKCQLVVANVNADSEAVINVKNGVILADGTVVNANLATAWVAGASAGAALNESNTFTQYDGAVDVDERLTNSEIIDALRAGEFLFIERRGRAVVEQDINSLTTFTAQRNQAFGKNRVVRVLDDIANSVRRSFEDNFIGQVTNNENGRSIFRGSVIEFLNSLQDMEAIENFMPEDVVVTPGEAKDSIVADVWVQPTDAMEKLYMTVIVN